MINPCFCHDVRRKHTINQNQPIKGDTPFFFFDSKYIYIYFQIQCIYLFQVTESTDFIPKMDVMFVAETMVAPHAMGL